MPRSLGPEYSKPRSVSDWKVACRSPDCCLPPTDLDVNQDSNVSVPPRMGGSADEDDGVASADGLALAERVLHSPVCLVKLP